MASVEYYALIERSTIFLAAAAAILLGTQQFVFDCLGELVGLRDHEQRRHSIRRLWTARNRHGFEKLLDGGINLIAKVQNFIQHFSGRCGHVGLENSIPVCLKSRSVRLSEQWAD